MDKRYFTIRQAREYTGIGEFTLLNIFKLNKFVIQASAGSPRFLDKQDIDKVLAMLKGKNVLALVGKLDDNRN